MPNTKRGAGWDLALAPAGAVPAALVTSTATTAPAKPSRIVRAQPPSSPTRHDQRSRDANTSPFLRLTRPILAWVSSCPSGVLIKRGLASRNEDAVRITHAVHPDRPTAGPQSG